MTNLEKPKNVININQQSNKKITANLEKQLDNTITIARTSSNNEEIDKIPSSDYFKKRVELFMSMVEKIKKYENFSLKDFYSFFKNSKSIKIFQELVLNMDTQNYYGKSGKDRKTKYQGRDIIIKNGSYEAKFIQVMLIIGEYNIDKENFKKLTYHIDGNIGMETARTIVDYKKDFQNLSSAKKYSDKTIYSHEKQETLNYIKGQLGDLINEIELTNIDTKKSRKSERNLKINIVGNNLEISSYGNSKSTIDLGKGKGNVKILGKYDFPYRLNLQYSDNGEILKNETNKTNITNMIQLINIVHSIIYDYIYSLSGEKIRNKLDPFYLSIDRNIYVDTGIIDDTTLISNSVINKVLKDSMGGYKNVNFLVNFLNTIYRDMKRETPKIKEVSGSRTI
ncbi:hypothetical protein HGA92_01135 [Candidatus Gracilibacteria bacterium]|nr:hypothetical protein [Candidatus Gracilibacteria bacterium]NUJ98787.1 hypothetical protein [Candidatus Gracilibacteria bacterium]